MRLSISINIKKIKKTLIVLQHILFNYIQGKNCITTMWKYS